MLESGFGQVPIRDGCRTRLGQPAAGLAGETHGVGQTREIVAARHVAEAHVTIGRGHPLAVVEGEAPARQIKTVKPIFETAVEAVSGKRRQCLRAVVARRRMRLVAAAVTKAAMATIATEH